MTRHHLELAERFVASRYPGADVAIVGGSTARGRRTATSDIDLLLVGDGLFTDGSAHLARTDEFEGEVFEVFAYTPSGFDAWATKGVEQFRPIIVDLLLTGVVVRDGALLSGLRGRWRAVYDGGAKPSRRDLDRRRYVVTDLLDDLRDAEDALERQVVAAVLFEWIAELMLLSAGSWIGRGKHLPRRLRELDAGRAEALAAPWLAGDLSSFADRVEAELDRLGGRVQAGFVR